MRPNMFFRECKKVHLQIIVAEGLVNVFCIVEKTRWGADFCDLTFSNFLTYDCYLSDLFMIFPKISGAA